MVRPRKVRAKRKTYDVICEAVDNGVAYGMRRAYKHSNDHPPDEEYARVSESVRTHVVQELCEALEWDYDNE